MLRFLHQPVDKNAISQLHSRLILPENGFGDRGSDARLQRHWQTRYLHSKVILSF